MSLSDWFELEVSPDKSILVLNESLRVHFKQYKPNRWWRFWQYVFFGFKWEDIK